MWSSAPLEVGSTNRNEAWPLYYLLVFLLTLGHFVASGFIPLMEDEAYYWTWSQHLSASYFDHPPLVAWVIRATCSVFGDNAFGIRVGAVLFSAGSLVALARLSSGPAVLFLLLFCPLFLLGSNIMTPDLPLVFFWTVYLGWTCRIQKALESWNCDPVTRVYHSSPISPLDWLGGGFLLGLGLLSKYTMLLAAGCSFVTFFARTPLRAWWKGYGLHLIVAGLLGAPVLYFNHSHHYSPLLFQWNHLQTQTGPLFTRFVELWAGQALLVGLVPLLYLPILFFQFRLFWNDPKLQPCFVFFVVPAVVFLYKSLTSTLELNWVVVLYVGCWPLVQRILQVSSFRSWNWGLLIIGFLPAWITSAALCLHSVVPLKQIPPHQDRFRIAASRLDIAKKIGQQLLPSTSIFLPNYQWTAMFRFAGIQGEQAPWGRSSQFTLNAKDPCLYDSIYYAASGHDIVPPQLECFGARRRLGEFYVTSAGKPIEVLFVYALSKSTVSP